MYRQKNTVGNLENVGFAKEGHEGLYNVYMMEETETIFAVGAGAVTKLVSDEWENGIPKNIVRIFTPKYPYEYLREYDLRKSGSPEAKEPISKQIFEFFEKENSK
jgi:oxygen-independent coproporphyrinogen-3 oxidase